MDTLKLLTSQQVREILTISWPTLNRFVRLGHFNKYHFPNTKRVYFKESEIEAALEKLDYGLI